MTPATSVPAERIFSLAGFVVRKKRTKLLPKHVNQQIFLAKTKDHIPHNCTVYSHIPDENVSDTDDVVVDDDV